MAYGYWKLGRPEQEAVFHLSFRKNPFNGGYAVACGLHDAIDLLSNLRFQAEDLQYLSTLRGNDGRPLFDAGFLDYLRELRFTCDVDAVPEGTVVFPHEPLVRVTGPILQAQIIETPLLNLLNFQTLIATKASRVCQATRGEPVLEFGLRRAQGVDGGLAASRAAYVGGVAATSNVLAGKLFGIPVKGTHAHSWVMSFDDELESFEAYARAMPNNCVFLVDTYDTLQGVRHAVEVGRKLRESGHEMVGIRLDSGDLAYLSIEARKILDEGGFPKAQILASNDLDEHIIASLKEQGATIAVWGVGTKLVTAYDQPALGGVYKLTAIQDGNAWRTPVKVSSDTAKITVPGRLGVRRFYDADGTARADMIWDELHPLDGSRVIVDPADSHHRMTIDAAWTAKEVLVPVFRNGERVYDLPTLAEARDHARHELGTLHPAILRQLRPHWYPAGLEWSLHRRRESLIEAALEAESGAVA
jgi:nicotinate phosphoribosyltransferase